MPHLRHICSKRFVSGSNNGYTWLLTNYLIKTYSNF